jgi:PKD repeat protein
MNKTLSITSNDRPKKNKGWMALRSLSIIFCLFFFGFNSAEAQTYDTCVKADFKFAVSNNTVKFEAKGSGPILLYVWDFGDNNLGRGKSIKHTYKKSGTYKACLTVYGFDTATKKRCKWEVCKKVTVKAPCNIKADFGFAVHGNDVKFEGKLQKHASYSWDFGDRKTGKGRLIKHTYANPGTYVVCLKVYDTTSRCSAKICKKVTVKPNCNSFKIKMDMAHSGNIYKFGAKSSTKHTVFSWTVNGTRAATGASFRDTFNKPGKYIVCVYAKDTITGCKAVACEDFKISNPCDTFKVAFRMAHSGNIYKFGASSNSSNTVYTWTVNGRKAARGATYKDTFNTPGKYIVCVYAYDTVSGCTAKKCEDFKILDPCDTFKIAFRMAHSGNIYKFGASSNSSNTVYTWTVNGQRAARGATYKDTFNRPGKYIVCVYAKDTVTGCTAKKCEDFRILDPCDTFKVALRMTHSGNIYKFGASSNSSNTVYTWTVNGQRAARGATYKDTFNRPGKYIVCVYAKDTVSGCTAKLCKDFRIADPCDTLKLGFEFKHSGPLYKFSAKSNSSNTVYSWSVNGKTVARGATWSDTFPRKGKYKICVTIKDTVTGCKREACKVIEVGDKCDYLEANFKYTNRSFKYGFKAKSNAKKGRYVWSFGDGKYGKGRNIRHTYAKPGRYKVCLTVIDLRTKCKTTVCKVVIVKKTCNLKADFKYSIKGNKVKFKARSNRNNVKYVWTFGDGKFGKGKRARHKYAKTGTYTVCLIAIQSNGCTVTVCKTIRISKLSSKMIAPEFENFDDTEPSMSVKPEMVKWEVTMAPNPVIHSTTITVSKIDAAKIEVYDMAGNKLMEILPNETSNVNMDELDRGFYFIRAYDEFGNAKTVKFLKH